MTPRFFTGAAVCLAMLQTTVAFTLTLPLSMSRCTSLRVDRIDPSSTKIENTARHNHVLCMAAIDDDLSIQLSKAKELLAKAKAKIRAQEKAKENSDGVSSIQNSDPASKKNKENDMAEKRSQVVNSETDSGLITTDAEMMLSLAEEEEWEARYLLDVFEREVQEDEVKRQKINLDRDIAKNMFGLRRSLINGDYERIFDKRNRRIGDI